MSKNLHIHTLPGWGGVGGWGGWVAPNFNNPHPLIIQGRENNTYLLEFTVFYIVVKNDPADPNILQPDFPSLPNKSPVKRRFPAYLTRAITYFKKCPKTCFLVFLGISWFF